MLKSRISIQKHFRPKSAHKHTYTNISCTSTNPQKTCTHNLSSCLPPPFGAGAYTRLRPSTHRQADNEVKYTQTHNSKLHSCKTFHTSTPTQTHTTIITCMIKQTRKTHTQIHPHPHAHSYAHMCERMHDTSTHPHTRAPSHLPSLVLSKGRILEGDSPLTPPPFQWGEYDRGMLLIPPPFFGDNSTPRHIEIDTLQGCDHGHRMIPCCHAPRVTS